MTIEYVCRLSCDIPGCFEKEEFEQLIHSVAAGWSSSYTTSLGGIHPAHDFCYNHSLKDLP